MIQNSFTYLFFISLLCIVSISYWHFKKLKIYKQNHNKIINELNFSLQKENKKLYNFIQNNTVQQLQDKTNNKLEIINLKIEILNIVLTKYKI